MANRDVVFYHEGTAFKAFPEAGSFFGVLKPRIKNGASKRFGVILLQVPMLADGTPDTIDGEYNVVEVSNMHEEGDHDLLAVINAEFGTALRQADFAGR